MNVLAEAAAMPARDLVDVVNSRLVAHSAGAPPSDDITMIAVRRGCRVGD